jgi:hypothetical protein
LDASASRIVLEQAVAKGLCFCRRCASDASLFVYYAAAGAGSGAAASRAVAFLNVTASVRANALDDFAAPAGIRTARVILRFALVSKQAPVVTRLKPSPPRRGWAVFEVNLKRHEGAHLACDIGKRYSLRAGRVFHRS